MLTVVSILLIKGLFYKNVFVNNNNIFDCLNTYKSEIS